MKLVGQSAENPIRGLSVPVEQHSDTYWCIGGPLDGQRRYNYGNAYRDSESGEMYYAQYVELPGGDFVVLAYVHSKIVKQKDLEAEKLKGIV